MADEVTKPTETPPASGIDPEKLGAAVAAGLRTALPEAMKPLIEEISGGNIRRNVEQPVRQAAPSYEDVSDDDIADAQIAGDKARLTALLRKRRQYDEGQRRAEIDRLAQAGGAAIGSVSAIAAERLPHYKGKYKKLIDEKVAAFRQNNPGVMVTPEHYKAAHDIVVGENIDEILASDREEVLRKAREPDPALEPTGVRGTIEVVEKEPENLSEVLAGDWKREFRTKQRAVGGRSDDEELRKLNFRGGIKEFVAVRKQMEAFEERTGGTFGLDSDWVDDTGRMKGDRGFNARTAKWQDDKGETFDG